jgi:TatD DNase family protein
MLIDSHCHLDYFPEAELPGVLARAEAAGVGLLLTISTKLELFPKVLAIAERHNHVYCSVGVHPHEAGDSETTVERLLELARHPKVVGIGETGLDYHYLHSPAERQRQSFLVHIAAARRSGLPLIVHSREADDDTARMLTEEMGKGAFRGLLHCFTASRALARQAIGQGFYISLSGIVTFKNADDLRRIAETVPPERLLIETDAPYLAPVPERGKRNEPSFLPHTAAAVAKLLNLTPDELERALAANFHALFTKVPAPWVRRQEAV